MFLPKKNTPKKQQIKKQPFKAHAMNIALVTIVCFFFRFSRISHLFMVMFRWTLFSRDFVNQLLLI